MKGDPTLAGVKQKRSLMLRELLGNAVQIDGDFVADRENGANQRESALTKRLLAIRHGVEENDVDREIERFDEEEGIDSFHFGIWRMRVACDAYPSLSLRAFGGEGTRRRHREYRYRAFGCCTHCDCSRLKTERDSE